VKGGTVFYQGAGNSNINRMTGNYEIMYVLVASFVKYFISNMIFRLSSQLVELIPDIPS
jgi:hypothetical protein